MGARKLSHTGNPKGRAEDAYGFEFHLAARRTHNLRDDTTAHYDNGGSVVIYKRTGGPAGTILSQSAELHYGFTGRSAPFR